MCYHTTDYRQSETAVSVSGAVPDLNVNEGSGIRTVLSGWHERAVCGNARPERPVGNTKTTPRENTLSATERERISP